MLLHTLLVSDIGMSDEDGYALIRHIRAREVEGWHIPAIALTGYVSSEDHARLGRDPSPEGWPLPVLTPPFWGSLAIAMAAWSHSATRGRPANLLNSNTRRLAPQLQ
jgi:CheY-like chemotaxis protein